MPVDATSSSSTDPSDSRSHVPGEDISSISADDWDMVSEALVDDEIGESPDKNVFVFLVGNPEKCRTIAHALNHTLQMGIAGQINLTSTSKENILACRKPKRGPQHCSKCGELRKGHLCQKISPVKASRRSKTSPNQNAGPLTMKKAPVKASACPTSTPKPSLN